MQVIIKNLTVFIDEEDSHLLDNYNWYFRGSKYMFTSYYCKKLKGMKMEYFHRMVMCATDSKVYIDHINGNTLDNRKINLRESNHSQNLCNRKIHKNNTSGYKGVSFCKHVKKKPWLAKICKDNETKKLGYYATKEEAALAYNKGALKYHGEYARLNKL